MATNMRPEIVRSGHYTKFVFGQRWECSCGWKSKIYCPSENMSYWEQETLKLSLSFEALKHVVDKIQEMVCRVR